MRYFAVVLLVLVLMNPGRASADSKTYTQTVRIEVPPTLQISSSQSQLNLSFPDTKAGSETNIMDVEYNVLSNSMSQADGATAVTAQLEDGLFADIDFKASFGGFSKKSGDTELAASSSGYVAIQDSATPIAVKTNSSNGGKTLNGSLRVLYKAVASKNLTSGNYSRQLTLTLTDI